MLNRSLVLIHPKEPFFQWLRTLPDPLELSPEDYARDSAAYLLQDFEDDEEQEAVLAHYCDVLFVELLSGWWNVEKDWPEHRDLETFKQWFHCEFHSLILDLVADPLIRED